MAAQTRAPERVAEPGASGSPATAPPLPLAERGPFSPGRRRPAVVGSGENWETHPSHSLPQPQPQPRSEGGSKVLEAAMAAPCRAAPSPTTHGLGVGETCCAEPAAQPAGAVTQNPSGARDADARPTLGRAPPPADGGTRRTRLGTVLPAWRAGPGRCVPAPVCEAWLWESHFLNTRFPAVLVAADSPRGALRAQCLLRYKQGGRPRCRVMLRPGSIHLFKICTSLLYIDM